MLFPGHITAEWILFVALAFWLWAEERSHRHSLAAVSLRIHVNGTRGKSTVTRLIAAGLRAGGHRTAAKTTGSAPMIILPDGREQRMKRRGPANIRELTVFFRLAAACGADTAVVECMAIRPELQQFSERRLVRSHIGVITNVRHDHEDVVGPGLESVGAALSQTVPAGGVLVTTRTALPYLDVVSSVPAAVVAVGPEDLPPGALEGFGFDVPAENVALALAVCEQAGVARETALAGMRAARPDAGNLTRRLAMVGGRPVAAVNALAANDPDSTLILWREALSAYPGMRPVVLLNCRADRRLRTRQLSGLFARIHDGRFLLTGDAAFAAARLREEGVAADRLAILPGKWGEVDLIREMAAIPEESVLLFAAGNIQGIDGFPFAETMGAAR